MNAYFLEYLFIYAYPSKFYILSLGFSDIETKQGFVIGVYLLYLYGVSFTEVQEGLIERAEGSSSGHCRCATSANDSLSEVYL